jgi:16S rRNA (uracil1498-N3)-methyltransferase
MKVRGRVYAPDLRSDDAECVLAPDESHHLAQVLRIRAGESVQVIDGRGGQWLATVATVGRREVVLTIDAALDATPEPPVLVTLGIGLLKGDQMDSVIRDATVLGASTVVPLVTDHVTVPTKAWQGGGPLDRWHRVAVAAAKQSGRAVVPAIQDVTHFDAFMASGARDAVVACIEPSADVPARPARLEFPRTPTVRLLVGPEGGWSATELDALGGVEADLLSLGPRTLRAEAVPIVALTLLWSSWGWTSSTPDPPSRLR